MTLELKWWKSAQNFTHLYIWTTLRWVSPLYLIHKLFETWVLLWTPIWAWCSILTKSSAIFSGRSGKSGSSPTTVYIWELNDPKLQSILISHQDLIIAIVCSMVCLENCLNRLQSVLNATARLVTRTINFDHITPVLQDFLWLPIESRSKFIILLLVYKCLYGQAPSYLPKKLALKPIRGLRLH